MPDMEIEPESYRAITPPKASRLNAILVLGVCLLVSPLLIVLAFKDELIATVTVISLVVGLAGGWAITRIVDPKPYVAEDDPTQLRNPVRKTWIGRALARPAGWDTRSAWTARIVTAVFIGLVLYWVKSRHGL